MGHDVYIKFDDVDACNVDVELSLDDICNQLAERYDIDRILNALFECHPFDWRDVQTWVEAAMIEQMDDHGVNLEMCPHCGSRADLRVLEPSGDNDIVRYYIYCTDRDNCGATSDLSRSLTEVTAKWNRRS